MRDLGYFWVIGESDKKFVKDIGVPILYPDPERETAMAIHESLGLIASMIYKPQGYNKYAENAAYSLPFLKKLCADKELYEQTLTMYCLSGDDEEYIETMYWFLKDKLGLP